MRPASPPASDLDFPTRSSHKENKKKNTIKCIYYLQGLGQSHVFFHPCSLTRRKVTTPEVNSRADSSDGVVDNTKSGANKPAVTCQDACPLIKKKAAQAGYKF